MAGAKATSRNTTCHPERSEGPRYVQTSHVSEQRSEKPRLPSFLGKNEVSRYARHDKQFFIQPKRVALQAAHCYPAPVDPGK